MINDGRARVVATGKHPTHGDLGINVVDFSPMLDRRYLDRINVIFYQYQKDSIKAGTRKRH